LFPSEAESRMKYIIESKGIRDFGVDTNTSAMDNGIVVFLRTKDQFELDSGFQSAYEDIPIPKLLELLEWIKSWYTPL
jgi:hypothetical protein